MKSECKSDSSDSFEEMLQLYDIELPLTMEKLKQAKKKLLLLHPDKNKVDTTKHFLYFRDIYQKLIKIYSYIHHETEEENLKKDVDIDTSFKTFIEKNNIHPVKNKEKYLKHFNEMFENVYMKQEEEEYGHAEWLKTAETYDMNDLEGSRKKLIQENSLIKIELQFEGTNAFQNKYSDIKEAHLNSIIGLDKDKLLEEKPKFKTVDEYNRYRQHELNKGVIMKEEEALKQLGKEEQNQNKKAIELSYRYMKQEESIKQKTKEYVSKYLLLS
jgi:hypothetical protein